MISGTTRVLTFLGLMALPWLTTAADAAQATTVKALVVGLAQQPPTRTRFAAARFSPMLDRALVTSGELVWLGGDHLQRKVRKPHAETTDITDGEVRVTRPGHGTRHFSLDRAPSLKVLLHGLVSVLSGNAAALDKSFRVRLDGDAGGSWTLTLRPHEAELSRRLTLIRLDGERDTLRCMEITDARGGATLELLGDLATRMPAKPARAALTALCRAP